jgi:hypothetical protein
MIKQIPINLCRGVSCIVRANPGVQSAYNLLTAPPQIPTNSRSVCRCITAHYAKFGYSEIFGRYLPPPAVLTIKSR